MFHLGSTFHGPLMAVALPDIPHFTAARRFRPPRHEWHEAYAATHEYLAPLPLRSWWRNEELTQGVALVIYRGPTMFGLASLNAVGGMGLIAPGLSPCGALFHKSGKHAFPPMARPATHSAFWAPLFVPTLPDLALYRPTVLYYLPCCFQHDPNMCVSFLWIRDCLCSRRNELAWTISGADSRTRSL